MSAFPNDTFYAPGQSYYLKAGQPVDVPSPLDVVETQDNLFQTRIETGSGGGIVGTSAVSLMLKPSSTTLASVNMFAQTATGENAIGFNVGQAGTPASNSVTIDNLYGVQSYLPIAVYNTGVPTAVSVTNSNVYGSLGADINLATSNVVVNSNVSIDQNSTITSTKSGGGAVATLTPADLTFSNASGTAKVGVDGAVAYFGYGTAPISNAGVYVDSNQSCSLQFTDGTNKGVMEMSGSNIVIGTSSVPAAISIDPAGVVDIPNLTYPSTINTTTLNAVYGNFTSNISVTDLSANFIYSPTINTSNLTALGSVNTQFINSNGIANLVGYYESPTTIVAAHGGANPWYFFYTISNVSADLIKCPSIDVHLPTMAVSANNYPNTTMIAAVGVIGNSMPGASSNTPVTYKVWTGDSYYGQPGSPTAPKFIPIGEMTFCLKYGVDYDNTTSNLNVCILGAAQNPDFSVQGYASNVHIRGYPW